MMHMGILPRAQVLYFLQVLSDFAKLNAWSKQAHRIVKGVGEPWVQTERQPLGA
jgi:hypothetical protein